MAVFGFTFNLSWTYDWIFFNCHHISYFLVTGVFGTSPRDKTAAQEISETTGLMAPIEKNKPLAQVGLKELISILHQKNVMKRTRSRGEQEGEGSSDLSL